VIWAMNIKSSENKLILLNSISYLSDGILVASIPLIASQIFTEEFAPSTLMFAFSIPATLSLFSGCLADSSCPKKIIIVSNVIRSLVSLFVAALIYIQSANLLIFSFLFFILGSCEIFYENTLATIPPKLISSEKLKYFNSKTEFILNLLQLIVGRLTGSLLTIISLHLSFLVNFSLYFISSFFCSFRLNNHVDTIKTDKDQIKSSNILGSLKWYLTTQNLPVMSLVSCLNNVLIAGLISTLPVLMKLKFDSEVLVYGFSLTSFGVGFITGSSAHFFLKDLKTFRGLLVSEVIIMLGMFSLMFDFNPTSVVVTFFFFGLSISNWNILSKTFRQINVPIEIFGKVTSAHRTIAWLGNSLGPSSSGIIIALFGTDSVLYFFSSISTLSVLLCLFLFYKEKESENPLKI